MSEPFKDPKHLANSADVMGRCCKSWQSSTAQYHFAVRDMIREQADALEALQAERDRLRAFVEDVAATKHGDERTPNRLSPGDLPYAARSIIEEIDT